MDRDDRAHRVVVRPDPVRLRGGTDDVQVDQEPVQDARERVEEPEEAHRRQRDGGGPGEEHEEAEDPLAPEAAHERVGEEPRADEHDRLRDHGEEERVPDRVPEERVRQLVAEVVQPDPLAAERARGRVREAQVDGENERAADQREDEEDGRGDQDRREKSAALGQVTQAPSPWARGRDRSHRGTVTHVTVRLSWPRSRSSS